MFCCIQEVTDYKRRAKDVSSRVLRAFSDVTFSEMGFCGILKTTDSSFFSFWLVCATWVWQKFSRSHSKLFPENEGTFICCAQWRISSSISPVNGKIIMFPNAVFFMEHKTKDTIPNQAIITSMFRSNNPVYLTLNQVVFYLFECLNYLLIPALSSLLRNVAKLRA